MKVGLVTSWGEECGIAAHSEKIVEYVSKAGPEMEFVIIAQPFTVDHILAEAKDCAIVHFSYETGLMAEVTPDTIKKLRAAGKKVLVTFHNIWTGVTGYPQFTMANPVLAEADRIVVQDSEAATGSRWFYVPQGVLQVETSDVLGNTIGTAGFPSVPLDVKGSLVAAELAKELRMGLTLFAPERPQHYPGYGRQVREQMQAKVPGAWVETRMIPQEDIVRKLSSCLFTYWGYREHPLQSGISGSVRLGCGARRPMIVSRCGMYRDLFAYEDEIYFVNSTQPTVAEVRKVAEQLISDIADGKVKRPAHVVSDMSWERCGRLYCEIYREMK